MASPNTIQYALVKETVNGTTPATPAYLIFRHVLGDNVQRMGNSVESPVIMPGGAADASLIVTEHNEGSLKTQLQRDPATDVLIESSMGANFTSAVVKAAAGDVSFTLQKQFKEGASTYFREWNGMRSKKLSVSADQAGIVNVSFDLIGMGEAFVATTGSTYAASSTTKRFTSLDCVVTIGGLTSIEVTKMNFDIDSSREAINVFGQVSPTAVGTSGTRKVTGSVTVLTHDYSAHTMTRNTKVGVAITIGQAGSGYKFEFPAAVFMPASDEENGAKMETKLDFTAGYDGTALTDVIVTRI